MSRVIQSAYQRAIKRFESNEIGNGIRAADDIWNHSSQRSDGMRIRITTPPEFAGTKKAISRYDWSQDLSLSRQLFARVGEISGAFRQKATYVIGDSWAPQFQGQNQEWGRLAESWLEYWFSVADVRGGSYDFITSLFVDCIHIDRDGDQAMLMLLVGGEPRVKFIPAHQIAFRSGIFQDINGIGTVPDGRFKGKKTYNGVIFDDYGREIGCNLLGYNAENDTQYGIDECQILYDPDWSDQGRGIPSVARASMSSAMDYEDILHFIKRQVKQDSAQGLLHYNEEGSAATSEDFITGRNSGEQNQSVKIEQLEGNEIMYFKSEGGGKLEPFRSERPHPNVDAHNMRLLRGILLSCGWFYELYDPREVGGASTRLIQDQARAVVNHRQRLAFKRWIRAISHGLSWAMEKGYVPRNEDNDWLDFFPTLPAKITVDARYDDKTKLERIRTGGGTYAALFGDEGKNWQKEIRQRVTEQKFLQQECDKQVVDIEKVQILTPNGNPQQAQGESADNESGGTDNGGSK
jgi:hypothetical protein